ncbi:hypothetical protein HDU97_006910 [Phlyctochytrium planicorne]|nr:hypothetical protein HDU97_006910 [Phlyctochytrium planicorne]
MRITSPSSASPAIALILLCSAFEHASAATIKQWLQQYSTTPFSDQHTKEPLTFSTAAQIIGSRSLGSSGTLFVPSDDVYKSSGVTTGGYAYVSGTVVDYSIKDPKPGDPDAGKFHYDYFTDADQKANFIFDDFAPGRPVAPSQKLGNANGDRQIYLFHGNEVAFSQCYITATAPCDDGIIHAISCALLPNPDTATVVSNRKNMGLNFGAWQGIIETAGLSQQINNATFNSITVFFPSDEAVASANLPGKYTPVELAKIVGYNIAVDAAYSSSASPGIFASTLFRPSSGQLANDVQASINGGADMPFSAGVMRGVNKVVIPPSFEGTFGSIPGVGQITPGAPVTTAAPSADATNPSPSTPQNTASVAPTTSKKPNGAVSTFGGAMGAAVVGLLCAVAF